MDDKIRRIRCGTKKCVGFFDVRVSTAPKNKDGNWQFHCPVCTFWSLMSETGLVTATSKEQFDLERLPLRLRDPYQVTRSPAGGT